MPLNRPFMIKHKTSFAILLFLILFSAIHYLKPSFAYGDKGEFRQFGLGYSHKTVVPIWTVAIGLAILSYLCILWIISSTTF